MYVLKTELYAKVDHYFLVADAKGIPVIFSSLFFFFRKRPIVEETLHEEGKKI